MRLSVGTSGFSYPKWRGSFYPEKCKPEQMLGYYGERLPAVEINNTFYRLPKRAVLEGWADSVPEGFRFAVKASRRITHIKRMKGAEDETAYLLDVTGALGAKLGVLLFQLPPNLKLDVERLDRFLELLPEGTPAAFEFRNPSWVDPAVHERLAARGFAWVVNDDAGDEEADLLLTAPWAYLRLRREGYARDELAAWASRLRARGLREAFVFFKHEDAGAAPKLATEFLEVAARAERRRRPRAATSAGEKRDREVG